MLEWLFKRKTVKRLEEQVADLGDRVVMLNRLYENLLDENRKQRTLVLALRDVNASLDERCNNLEKGRP